MALDPSIILAGQAPNIIGAIDAGNIAGQRRNEFVRTNALNAFLQQNGPGVMAGDQNALAGLARFDPTAALGVQDQRQQMAARDQAMTMARQQAREQAQAQAAQMTAEQRAQEAAMLERVLAGASSFYAQGDQAGYTSWLQQNQIDPAQYPFEQFPAIAATAGDVLDTLKTFQDMNAPPPAPEPNSAIAKLQADLNAGLITQDQYNVAVQGMAPSGMSLTTNPDGTTTFTQGPGVTDRPATESQAKNNLFGGMMDVTSGVINDVETRYDPSNLQDAAAAQAGWAGNYMLSADAQNYQTAAAAWAENVLRIQTGAAAQAPEIARVVKTYFAQPGDYPETVALKRQLREAFLASLTNAQTGTYQPGDMTLPPDPLAAQTVPDVFKNTPGVADMAAAQGITVDELWQAMPEEDRKLWAN
jgi:hypothetical protein